MSRGSEIGAAVRHRSGGTRARRRPSSAWPARRASRHQALEHVPRAWATGSSFIQQSPATQATSGFHGKLDDGRGVGLDEHVRVGGREVEPGGEACEPRRPIACMSPAASAGTSLARCVPNRSVKLNRKYLDVVGPGVSSRDRRSSGVLRERRLWRGTVGRGPRRRAVRAAGQPSGSPVPGTQLGAGERHACHRRSLDGQRARGPRVRGCARGSCRRRARWSAPRAS